MTNLSAQPSPHSVEGLLQVDKSDEFSLGEVWRALKRRKKIVCVTAAVVIAITCVNTAHKRIYKSVYQGSFALLITDPISSDSGNNSAAASGLNGRMFEELARNTTSNDLPTLIELLQSPLLLSPIAERFDLSADGLASRISISTGGARRWEAEGILKVSLVGRDKDQDQQLLTALSDTYLKVALQERQQRLADGLNFLNKQAPALEAKTEQIQSEVAAFRIKHSLLEPTAEGGALKQQESELSNQVRELQAGRNRLSRVRQEIANGALTARGFQEALGSMGSSGTGAVEGGGLTISDVDQSLLQQLLKVETELAEARSTYLPSSSMVTGLEERINQLKPLLLKNQLEAVDAALNLNNGRLETAKQQVAELNAQFLKQPTLIKQYEALQTRLKIANENLAGLVSARENFQLEIAQRSVPWRVIDPPEINPNPIEPSVPKNLAMGTLLGLVAGAGAGLLRDRKDHVFHSPGEVKVEIGDLPLLGHVPYVDFFKGVRENKRFLLRELDSDTPADSGEIERKAARYQRFFYQEAFRNLYTSLRFLNSDKPLRSIALTSSLPAEGKSLVITLLTKTLSEMGQRVLLIDADLRKPQLHHRLGINNLRGLSNVLTDESTHWKQALQSIDGYEGWAVMTAGRRPPDPTRLLTSKRMNQLVEEIESSGEFDLILFDTPPVLGLADAVLVAEHCDGLMLLVSLDQVDRSLPKECVNRIRTSGGPLLGVVTNSIKHGHQGYSAYGYGKYGYEKYKFGKYRYGDYDSVYDTTTAAYAHYADIDDAEGSTGSAGPQSSQRDRDKKNKSLTLRKRLRASWSQFIRWVDN